MVDGLLASTGTPRRFLCSHPHGRIRYTRVSYLRSIIHGLSMDGPTLCTWLTAVSRLGDN